MALRILRIFVNINIYCSKVFEMAFWFNKNDKKLLYKFFDQIRTNSKVADVGGGKKPAKNIVNRTDLSCAKYDGYDIDIDELTQAKKYYSEIFVTDLTISGNVAKETYDYVVCLNTLEHVKDASNAVENLANMLSNGGFLYLKLPCRHALFAQLNLILPNELKKSVMHLIFPSKIGDGFQAYYHKSTPNEMIKVCTESGLEVVHMAYVRWSSYFSFFFPLYVIWRIYTLVQRLCLRDYCESFEIILRKKSC